MAVALVSRRGTIRARLEEPVDTSSPQAPIDQIVRLSDALVRPDGGRRRRRRAVTAAGVAVPGLARPDGTVWAPNLPGWSRVPLARLLRKRLRTPVVVDSDRNAAVLGESWRGAARGERDVVVLLVGTGIGAGILSGGRLVRGAHELSGCAGWMVVTPQTNARTARCGSLEALAAGPALARAARTRDARAAAERARRGEVRSLRAFARAGDLLGLAVANVISLFDPASVVLTGGLFGAGRLLLPAIKRRALERAQPLSARRVKIAISRLGAEANLLGAAWLAWTSLESR